MIENLWRGVGVIYTTTGESLADKVTDWIREKQVPVVKTSFSNADLSSMWECYDALIFVMALEGVVRTVCRLAKTKDSDPPIISVDDLGKYVVPVLGGHWGANEIAEELSSFLRASPVITTASELFKRESVEYIAKRTVSRIVNPEQIVKVNAAILRGEKVCTHGFNIDGMPEGEDCNFIITTLERDYPGKVVVRLKELPLHVGIGSKREVDTSLIERGIVDTVSRLGLNMSRISTISSIRRDVMKVAERLGVEFRLYNLEEVNSFSSPCLTPQGEKLKQLGIRGVAEVCALKSAGDRAKLVLRKVKLGNSATLAIAAGE